jgi:hypothetical protein
LTPREIAACMEGARRRFEREQQLAAWTAWHAAALSRVKKMPKLETLIPSKRKKSQTPDEMLAAAMRWHARLNAKG